MTTEDRPSVSEPLGRVYLVGAGPGSASLLTLRAIECLASADFVLYDRLVSRRALTYAPGADYLCVDQLPGCHPERWPHINQTMIEAARQGKTVVRLKGGDPSIFGRGGEEAEALREAGIAYEIVPGVTASLGAAAYAGFPLTHRRHASAVAMVTGHEDPEKPDSMLDWEALARFPGTLVFYMGIKRLDRLVEALIKHGRNGNEPAALIQWATRGSQRTVETTLEELPQAQKQAQITNPALIVIGSVLSLRSQQSWFEQLPLLGKRVLITRPEHQATDALSQLEQLGAEVLSLPTVEISEPEDWAPVDQALEKLSEWQWLVFTSSNGVHAFIRRLRQKGLDLRALGDCRLAVIGPSTGEALKAYHLEPDLIPEVYRSEHLAEALKKEVSGMKVLLARADRGRELLRDELIGVAKEVHQVAVYSQKDVLQPDPEVLEQFQNGQIDYVTLTSSNIARSLAKMLNPQCHSHIHNGTTKLISISPVTTKDTIALGWPVHAEATVHDLPGVIDALIKAVQ